jgi:putative transposase
MHKHLRRLDRVWIPHAVYFITTCVHGRRKLLNSCTHVDALLREWQGCRDRHGWLIGRYVIMPDHVHFFCAEDPGGAKSPLSAFVGAWKEWTAKALIKESGIPSPVWQKQFFDHVLRHGESYAEKWNYVRENPVRAGLVHAWTDWPYQGFVDFDEPL